MLEFSYLFLFTFWDLIHLDLYNFYFIIILDIHDTLPK